MAVLLIVPPSAETISKDLRDVVLHEVCHAYIIMPRCLAFALFFKRNENENLAGRDRTWGGRVHAVGIKDNDIYKDAIYGWAGIVGDFIESNRATAVDKAWALYERGKETISATDLENIEKVPPEQRRKAAEDAFDVLVGKWEEIKSVQLRIAKFVEKNIRADKQVNAIWREDEGWVSI